MLTRRRGGAIGSATAATATALPAGSPFLGSAGVLLLQFRIARLLLLLLATALLLGAAALALLLRLLLLPAALRLLLPAALWTLAAAGAASASFFPLRRRLAGPLLELADLLLHEAAGLLVLFRAQLVVPAIGAALPPLGVSLFAGRTGDAFGQRHRESARIVHFAPMDEDRRRTLLTLIELAGGNSPSACWDDRRAMELLRARATREELRELGADETLIEHVFAEEHAG